MFVEEPYNFTINENEDHTPNWDDLLTFLKVCLKQQNIVVVKQEDFGILETYYAHDEDVESWGCKNPYWITEEEYSYILQLREDRKKESNEEED